LTLEPEEQEQAYANLQLEALTRWNDALYEEQRREAAFHAVMRRREREIMRTLKQRIKEYE
jgi:hypothetical protein